MYEFVVVGSGISGAQACQTLVERNSNVLLLDAGFIDKTYKERIPNENFSVIRKTDYFQHFYFLGKNYEGISWGALKTGAQLTPPRMHVISGASEFLPFFSDNFFPMESLAYGGLGSAWGAGCFVFSKGELERAGLLHEAIVSAYDIIAKRIVISGERDNIAPYTLGSITGIQPSIRLNNNFVEIIKHYEKNCSTLKKNGFLLGRTALAVLSEAVGERRAHNEDDMDFWSDQGKSVYRPWMTVDTLKSNRNFIYQSNVLVTHFKESLGVVEIFGIDIQRNLKVSFRAKKLVLASGVLSTARIVLRSMGYFGKKLPIISNSYSYVPCLQPRMIGKKCEEKRISLARLTLVYDPVQDNVSSSIANLFSYQSLLLFRILKEVPLNFSDTRAIMHVLYPATIIAGVHHPEESTDKKYIRLVKNSKYKTGDLMMAEYCRTSEENRIINERNFLFEWALRRLGCYPLRRMNPGNGASIHYAGTLPFSKKKQPLHLSPEGLLWGTHDVYIADGSGFRFLPAKGPSLTLMANAHTVAIRALDI